MVADAVHRKAQYAGDHRPFALVFQGQKREQLLADDQRGDAYRLAEDVVVEHLQIRLGADQDARGPRDNADGQQRAGQQPEPAGHHQRHGEQVVDPAAVTRQITPVEHLRAADEHDARRVQEVIQRPEQADGAHGGLADEVAGIQAVHDAVDRGDDQQQHLVRQELEKQPRQQLVFRRIRVCSRIGSHFVVPPCS